MKPLDKQRPCSVDNVMASIKIRVADSDDVTWLLDELKKFSSTIQTVIPVYDHNDEKNNVLMMSNLVENHVVLIAESNKIRMGFIAGSVSKHPFNSKLSLLSEMFWWVTEKYRGSRAGSMLFNEFKRQGREVLKVKWIVLTTEADGPISDESLERRGFKLIEKTYIMEVV